MSRRYPDEVLLSKQLPSARSMKDFMLLLLFAATMVAFAGGQEDVNWLDAAPGVAMEYKVSS